MAYHLETSLDAVYPIQSVYLDDFYLKVLGHPLLAALLQDAGCAHSPTHIL